MSRTNYRTSIFLVFIIILVMVASAWWLLKTPAVHTMKEHDHETTEPHVAKGSHGGRLLSDGDFSLELTIFENGVPPEFHVYPYVDNKAVAPDKVTLSIELARLGGQVDKISFIPQDDYLRGKGVVTEPHSFDVKVAADFQGKSYQWSYDNYEGRTRIAPSIANESGIVTGIAGPGVIHETLGLTGRVQTDPGRLAHVRARYPGMVKSVKRNLGDAVRAGEVLATVQSNESLQTYAVKAPINGIIVHRNIQVGEATTNESLFTITDPSQVWIEFDIFDRDLGHVKKGQTVKIETLDKQHVTGKIDWISPLATHASQSVRARVVLANPDGRFRSGQFVRGHVTIAEHNVPLAVRLSAIQQFRDFKVVFARFKDIYEVRMIDPGRRDQEWVEVLSGLEPGTEYVIENSYLIKADIEKSGASHDH